VTDSDGAIETPNLSKVLRDGGYSGENFANAVKSLIGAEVEEVKRNELHTFAILPKRWVVERTLGWLEKFRRLWKNCERKIHATLQMTVLAFISLLLEPVPKLIDSTLTRSVLGQALAVFQTFSLTKLQISRLLSQNFSFGKASLTKILNRLLGN
jgi:transposase